MENLSIVSKTELSIAWRYIKSRGREKFISVTAMFSLVGVALGVATLIIVTSVMNGFRHEFTERIIGFNGHVAMHPFGDFSNYQDVTKHLLEIPGVKSAIPEIGRNALISNEQSVRGTLCHGIAYEDLVNKDLISQNIVRGSLANFAQENAIILGETLAIRSNLYIGSDVIVIVPELDETGVGLMPRKKTFKLVATFKSGMHEYDMNVSLIPLQMAQKLFKLPKTVSSISVFVDNPMKIVAVTKNITDKFEEQFNIVDWKSSNSSFMKAIEIERNVMFLILTLITLVASFNIISCMIMLVKDKEKDIAILRTIGLSRAAIMRIFFMIGTSIGTTGTLFGALSGVLFSINIKTIQGFLETALGTQVFSPEVYFLTNLPSILFPSDVAITVLISFLLSCLSTIYPSRKAGKINPTEILRYA